MRLLRFMVKRILIMILTVLIVMFLVFCLLRTKNSNPLSTIIGTRALDQEARQTQLEKYNLDKPVIVQYGIWLNGIFQGDWGISYDSKQPAFTEIGARIPVTVGLVIMSMLIALIIAVPVGLICAYFKNGFFDGFINIILLVVSSTPPFLSSLLLLLLVSVLIPNYQFTLTYTNFFEYLQQLFTPSIAVSFTMVGMIARVMRSSVMEQMKSNYYTTALAKGMKPWKIMIGHVLPNSIIPVLTISSIMVGVAVSGTLMAEYLFSLPGLGSLLLKAIQCYNYPLVEGIVLIILGLFLIISFCVDILYTLIDPRITL